MILDLLAQQKLYRNIHPGFAPAFDWLARFDARTPDGRIDIQGDRVFALVQSYATAPAKEKKFETHRDHIDIQYLAGGAELMQFAPVGELQVETPYDPAKDAVFYREPAACVTLRCGAGSFTVFFPHDGHRGGCSDGAPAQVKKVVIKVRV